MYYKAKVISHFNEQSSKFGDEIDLTQSSSNEEILDSQFADVIDLTQSSSNEEIIDLTQSDSDYSTTHFSSSFDDELGTSPDDDDDSFIPPPVIWNGAKSQAPPVEPRVGFENFNIEFNAICSISTYFNTFAFFITLYTKNLNELISGGGGSYKSASFLACMKKILNAQRWSQYSNTFHPDLLKLTNPNRNEYLNHLKNEANLSGSVHKNLSVKVCTWFASVESSNINLKPSSFTCTRGNRKENFITCAAFREWLDAQPDLV